MDMIKQILMGTGALWWCYIIFIAFDRIGKWMAMRRGENYQDIHGEWHRFATGYDSGKDTTIHTREGHLPDESDITPKKKWERFNAEEDTDTTDDV